MDNNMAHDINSYIEACTDRLWWVHNDQIPTCFELLLQVANAVSPRRKFETQEPICYPKNPYIIFI